MAQMLRSALICTALAAVIIGGLLIARHFSSHVKVGIQVDQLRKIAAKASAPADAPAPANWTDQGLKRLAELKAHVRSADDIGRALDHELATKYSACAFVEAAGSLDTEIAPARQAVQVALTALLDGTKERIKAVVADNKALGWIGWRGSRETEIYQLVLLAHDITTTMADADVAFTRLIQKAATFGTMKKSCG